MNVDLYQALRVDEHRNAELTTTKSKRFGTFWNGVKMLQICARFEVSVQVKATPPQHSAAAAIVVVT